MAFYDALAANELPCTAMGDDKLQLIAAELIAQVKKSVSIDWTLRESARAKIKVMVKRILNKYGYLPDLQEDAAKTVLMQAELLWQIGQWHDVLQGERSPGRIDLADCSKISCMKFPKTNWFSIARKWFDYFVPRSNIPPVLPNCTNLPDAIRSLRLGSVLSWVPAAFVACQAVHERFFKPSTWDSWGLTCTSATRSSAASGSNPAICIPVN